MFHGLSAVQGQENAWTYFADMAYSPSSFRSYLKNATGVPAYDDGGDTLSNTCGAKKWTIALGPERFEGIALLKMSRLTMHLRLDGYSREEGDAFLERFLKHYLRGGG
jgi:hypothetical protein